MKQTIKSDDFLKNKMLTNLKINSSRDKCLYLLNTLNLDSNNYEKNVGVFELGNLSTKHLDLEIQVDDFEFYFDQVVFKVNKDKYTELYYYDFDIDEVELYITIPYSIKRFVVYDKDIYFTANLKEAECDKYIKCGTRIPFYQEGFGFSATSRTCLFKIDSVTSEVKRLTDKDIDIDDIEFNVENKKIVFTAFKYKTTKPSVSDIYTYDLVDKSIKKWTKGTHIIEYVNMFNSKKIIFAGININKKKSSTGNHQFYLLDTSIGIFKSLNKYSDRSLHTPGVSSDVRYLNSRPVMLKDKNFYFLTTDRYQETLNKINQDGEVLPFETGLRTIDSYQVFKDGILIIGLKGLKLHELYWYSEGELIQITEYNEWLLEERYVSVPEPLNFYDGKTEIDGWVIPPINIEAGKKYPGVLLIHGGPRLIYTDIYYHHMQLLAANGYYVFFCNPSGSDGRGEEFLNIKGIYGIKAYNQLMKFTDFVIKKYDQLNESNLGVSGYSYGGYMTNYIITKTNRFKAAVSESGISNLMTAFTVSDIGYLYFREYMNDKTPWSNIDDFLESSPIIGAHKVTTPTLFMHGKEDCRCNYTESLNMHTSLNIHNIKTKLCLFDGENHGLDTEGRPTNRKKRYVEFLNWFNIFLKVKI